jgi:hypothetical protein
MLSMGVAWGGGGGWGASICGGKCGGKSEYFKTKKFIFIITSFKLLSQI